MELGQQSERHEDELSAAQEVEHSYSIPVVAIATLNDLLGYLQDNPAMVQNLQAVQSYRDRYGIERKKDEHF
jgi:orotate phosphoribosyltransferase